MYFNQATGRMVMIDKDGFITLLKCLKRETLNKKEEKFCRLFFDPKLPQKVELRLDPSIQFNNSIIPYTKTPVLIDLSLNNYCNLSCDFCYMSAKPINAGEHLSMQNFDILLKKMKRGRVLQIALGGGEPTLHPQFPEILRRLRTVGNIIPNYTTNGTNLTPAILEATKQYCGAVAVSYSEERTKETIIATKKLISSRIQTNLHLVLLKSRISRLADITRKYAKLGIKNVVILLFKPMGRGKNLTHEILDSDDRKTLSIELLKILALHKKYGVRLSIDACSSFIVKDFPFLPQSIVGCTGAIHSAYIDWKLDMKPCSFMQETKGVNLKEFSIHEAWQMFIFKQFRHSLLIPRYDGCKVCDHISSCWGGCPVNPDIVFCEKRGRKTNNSYIAKEIKT